MRITYRLRPDARNLHLQQDRGGQDARLDVSTDGDDHAVEFVNCQLAKRFFLRRISADNVREEAIVGLNDVLGAVDAEHFGTALHELEGESAAESTKPDDGDRVGFGDASGGRAER